MIFHVMVFIVIDMAAACLSLYCPHTHSAPSETKTTGAGSLNTSQRCYQHHIFVFAHHLGEGGRELRKCAWYERLKIVNDNSGGIFSVIIYSTYRRQ